MPILTLLSQNLSHLPEALHPAALDFIDRLGAVLPEADRAALDDAEFALAALKVCSCSHFVRDNWLRHPQLLTDLLNSGDLRDPLHREHYAERIDALSAENEGELGRQLRLLRRREMTRIAWRDLAGWSDLDETLADLSLLAEHCIRCSLDFLYRQACQRWGTPTLADGTPFNMVILGMGKLGAWELNYSSDIDLIYAYAEDGVLTEKKEISYSEFFTRIGRSLAKMLDEITADGFVFRTDLRLRPFGDSGPLVMSFGGMEHYYLSQAREWERYAMIKARPVAGDENGARQLMAMIKPFVYRRYLDYGAFEELRSLKFQISQELRRRDRMDNIKLGPGGIREVEFIGQAFQLIRGGKEQVLQQREIQIILQALADLQLMPAQDVATLKFAYRFLRRVENHIQQFQDQQTHDLPENPQTRQILAYSMDFADWAAFKAELDEIRDKVQLLFEQVFSLSTQDNLQHNAKLIWNGHADDESRWELLAEYNFSDPAAASRALSDFKNSAAVRRMSRKGESVLERLMPLLIEQLSRLQQPDTAFHRIIRLFESVAGRTVYFSLLAENPSALKLLIKLTANSPWISAHLAQSPILLDELLDQRSLFAPLSPKGLQRELDNLLGKIDIHDSEALMFALRQFKNLNVLRVAAADLMDIIAVMVVSDYLSSIAETLLHCVLQCAWLELGNKYGYPPGMGETPQGFAIVGFGKLGGIELGYASDLDLLFVRADVDGNAVTTGARPIGLAQFYLRLAQKVCQILDTRLLSGILYEVDLRLRPNGDSGLLVAHIDYYLDYLLNHAWTWELQALVRARCIAGDAELCKRYNEIRHQALTQPRDCAQLQKDVREMREKMRQHLDSGNAEQFDLKHSAGGITDIEFMVQFAVLAYSHRYPELTAYTDNVQLLATLSWHGAISTEQAVQLTQAYCAYRDYGHHQILKGLSATAEAERFVAVRATVQQLWQQWMEQPC
jgi:[glutamine synthetase] adenylyltransferase / [glutamine synthetase]-adenylyl-L-tyrosine phosphorylase